MTHRNDDKLSALQTLLAISGGTIDDLESAWLTTVATTFGNVGDMWQQVFQANGATSDNINDAAYEFLGGLGYTGSLPERWKAYWVAGGGGTTPTGQLVYDTFTDSDATALTAHTPDIDTVGGGWIVPQGAISIQNNTAEHDGAGYLTTPIIGYVDCGNADVDITVDATPSTVPSGSNYLYILFRYVDLNNYWQLSIGQGDNQIVLYEQTGGTYTVRGLVNKTINSGTTYALNVVADGQSITCTVDGGDTITYNSATAHQTATKHGIRSYVAQTPSVESFHDNFTVTAL